MSETTNLTELLNTIEDDTQGDELKLGDVIELFENRGFGPLLLMPALLALLPTGSIPGVPTICAVLTIVIAGQLLVGRNHPWLPKWLKEISVDRERLTNGLDKAKSVTRYVDKLMHPRLELLTNERGSKLVAVACILLATIMIPLELVPMAAALPASAIVLLALGISVRDGLVVSIGLVITVVATASALQLI